MEAEVAEGHVTDGGDETFIYRLEPLETAVDNVGIGVELSGNAGGDGVDFDTDDVGCVWRVGEEVARAGPGF